MNQKMTKHMLSLMLFTLSLFLMASSALARTAPLFQCAGNETAKLIASDRDFGDRFGVSVSFSDHVAVIGVPKDDDRGEDSGSAYVYRFDGTRWNEEAKLTASDGILGDHFGWSVSVSGEVVVIGAMYDHNQGGLHAGAAYVFRFDGIDWVEEVKLVASDGSDFDEFGRSVFIQGDVVVVGAPEHYVGGQAYVYIFDGVNWNEEAILAASDRERDSVFSWSVSMDNDVILVGDFRDDDNGFESGSAYVFRFDGAQWNEEAKLLASDGESTDYLGAFVSVSGDVVVAGATGGGNGGERTGAAYVYRFQNGNWIEQAKLVAGDAEVGDIFAQSVSVNGETILIGSEFGDNDQGINTGSAYVYRFDGGLWREKVELYPSDGEVSDHFGNSVLLNGNTALIGAQLDDNGAQFAGSAYFFDIVCCTGRETIKRAVCSDNVLNVRVTNGVEGSEVEMCVAGQGECQTRAFNERGRARAKFYNMPIGTGTVSAAFECGSSAAETFVCE